MCTEFFKKYKSVYFYLCKNGWINEFLLILNPILPKEFYYIKENSETGAFKYKIRSEFCKKNDRVYKICSKNGWLDEFFPKTQIFT